MALAAEEALVKIDAVLPEPERDRTRSVQVHAISMPNMTDDLRLLIDLLETSVEQRTRLSFDYSDNAGQPSRRVVRPLGLWFWGKVWTLVAWCELRRDFRIFRIDRIASLVSGDQFRTEPDKSLAHFFATKAYLRPDP